MTMAWRIYRGLAEAFPHEFKMAYGDEMVQAGEETMQQIARRHGVGGMARLIGDAALRLPLEYASEIGQDLRYAARSLKKSPGFALVGIVSMGLGIGLTTTIYSSGWSMITRTLPGVANAKRLVTAEKPLSYYYIEQFREQKSLFAGVAAVETGVQFNVNLPDGIKGRPERVYGQIVTPDYFAVLGMQPQQGRLLSAEQEKTGDAPVVVISDRFWKSRLHGEPDAVGATIRVNGQAATIVGITPRKFDGALSSNVSEIFVPTTVPAAMAPELADNVLEQRNAKQFMALMVLAPHVSFDQAEAALDGIVRRLDKLDPMAPAQADTAKRVVLVGAGTRAPIPRQYRPMVVGFYGALMAIVMAIACLNLATMLLARGGSRRKELAIRLGVGASRFRLMRQMVTEGILLSLLGGTAGFALAYGLHALNAHAPLPAGAPVAPDLSVDWHAAIFAFLLSVVCGIGFSLAPALQATKTNVAPALKEASALQLSGYRRFGMRNLAIGAQVAGSLLLLLVTGFLVLGLTHSTTIETHFDQRTMAFVGIDPVRDGYTPEKAQAFFEKLPEQLRNTPGMGKFAMAAQAPYLSTDDDEDIQMTAADSHVQHEVAEEKVGAGYFSLLNEPMLMGREFAEQDERIDSAGSATSGSGQAVALPVVMSEKVEKALFGKSSALGKRIRDDRHSYEVVGVVRDMKNAMGATMPVVYLPLTRHDYAQPPAGGIALIVRGHSAADALRGVRDAVGGLDPNLTLFNAQSLSEYLERMRVAMGSALRMFAGIGLFGLVLSAVGLAGVTGYAVAQRKKEIGIRMALGARKAQVLGLVLREGMWLIAAGSVVGFLGAVVVAKALSALTNAFGDAFTVGTNDPRLIVGAPLLLAGLALLACYVPARRATEVDPLRSLRDE